MTEDEAKTKWCPFTKIAALEGTSDVGLPRAALCIGSACMAWRWTHHLVGNDFQPPSEWPAERTDNGYCGLAGRPS